MSFSRYPEYKDSGVEWLDEVPSSWCLCKVKHISRFFTGWTPPTGRSDFYIGDNPWANISDLGPKILNKTAKSISNSAIEESQILKSKKGSLLFSFKLSIGQVSFAGVDMYTNEAIATFPESDFLDLGYAFYAYPIFLIENASTNIYGAKLLNQELIGSAIVALPTIEEQKSIASFLDHEISKIDSLVKEQDKLIGLLKEKRQAVISHSVTKGLDPNVKMKDSGVEWLGEVPEHWNYLRARAAGNFSASGIDKKLDSEEIAVRMFNYLDVYNSKEKILRYNENLMETTTTRGKILEHSLRNGDLLFTPSSETADDIGHAALVKVTTETVVYSYHLLRFRPSSIFNSEFLKYYFNSIATRSYFESVCTGTTRMVLVREDFKNIWLTYPSIEEQHTIVNFINKTCLEIDDLIDKSKVSIILLKERRSALISAAVTGQIDVRNYQNYTLSIINNGI